jgi:hypothetical protein
LRHYKALFGISTEFATFTFTTADRIYYSDSDLVCFLGPVAEPAVEKIKGCIEGYGTPRVAINVHVIRNEATGECTVDLLGNITEWHHGSMGEIILYYSREHTTPEDSFHFVEFDTDKIRTREGRELSSAKTKIDELGEEWEDWSEQWLAEKIKECEQKDEPVPERLRRPDARFRRPVVKFVSLVLSSANGASDS